MVAYLCAAGLLAVAGCGDEPERPGVDYSRLGVEVPSPKAAYTTPAPKVRKPGDTASPVDQILYDLQERVVRTAGVSAGTSARCAGGVITGTVDQTVGCTVSYQGLVVKYHVEITGGRPTFSWVATTRKSVLTADGVTRAYWAKYGPDASEVRCDKMPAKRLVPLDEKLDFRCYHEGSDGWQEHRVVLGDGEITFEDVDG